MKGGRHASNYTMQLYWKLNIPILLQSVNRGNHSSSNNSNGIDLKSMTIIAVVSLQCQCKLCCILRLEK